ncbi:hypothetical protein ACFVGN_42585, partial [Streptomyces sp. NPDC057757]
MSQPTGRPIAISNIAEITGVADVTINGTDLWVSPGQTPAGRYWTLFAAVDNRLAGVVVEHGGLFEAVLGGGIAHT